MASESDPFELRRFLEKFRRILQVQNPAAEADLPTLLEEYDRLCERASQRLRECFVLFQRGQYSNAVLLSEREPNLLDQCTQLEIPERDMLASVAQILNVKAPSLVDRDLFAALQECYEKGSTAATNLKLLQRLTLARAPLPTRLAIMRRLAVQNPNHPFLDGDIRVFEKAWFKRANDFAQAFAKLGRPEVIEEIVQDLQEGGYLETPQNSLIPQLQAQIARATSIRLPILADEIRTAFAERSYVTLRQLAGRWKALTGEFGSPEDDTQYGIGGAMSWVRNAVAEEEMIERRNEARLNLADMIDDPESTRDELEIAYHQAKSAGAVDIGLGELFNSRLAKFERRRIAIIVGAVATAALVVGLLIVVILLAYQQPTGASVVEKEQTRKDSLAQALKKIQAARSDADVKMLAEVARGYALTDDERQEIDRLERQRQSTRTVSNELQTVDFGKQVAALKETSAKLLADVRRGHVDAVRSAQVEELRTTAKKLREHARESGQEEGEVASVEKSLAEADQWKALAASLAILREEMKGAPGTIKSIERLAGFLDKQVAGLVPDAKIAQRARQASVSLPAWRKVIQLRNYLQAGRFLSGPSGGDDWKGLPPSGPLAAAIAHGEMIRQRDPANAGSTSARLKDRLTRVDMTDLWRINKVGGDEWAYWYTKKSPAAGGIVQVDVLMDSNGRVVRTPIPANRVVIRAPQSELGATAVKMLWESPGPDPWPNRVAQVYDRIIESKRIDPLLQLELARALLTLADVSSEGYRELLKTLPGYKEIIGSDGDITGNWLDAGLSDELLPKRERAKKLIDGAPRLRPRMNEAQTLAQQRIATLKRGLVVSGWVCRDDGGLPVLEKLGQATPDAASRLYTVVGREWIILGAVSRDGKRIELNAIAEEYIGWPVFAVLLAES
jgi:hypothetical protein